MGAGTRVVVIAHGHPAALVAAWQPARPIVAGDETVELAARPGAISLLGFFGGMWTTFARDPAFYQLGPRGLLLTWHRPAGTMALVPRVFTLHLPGGATARPPLREAAAQRGSWASLAATLPPLPSAPDDCPVHFALFYTQDGMLHARVSAAIPLTALGCTHPAILSLPPGRWPVVQAGSHLRLLSRTSARSAAMASPFRDGWALVPSGPVPQAAVSALQDAGSGERWLLRPGQPAVHTLRRRQIAVETFLDLPSSAAGTGTGLPGPGSPWQGPAPDLVADVLLLLLLAAGGRSPEATGDASGTWATGQGLLDLRGVQRMQKREGAVRRQAGHRTEDLCAIAAAMALLEGIQVRVTRQQHTFPDPASSSPLAPLLLIHEVRARAGSEGEPMPVAWRYTLGPWAGELWGGREPLALFPQRALMYDPYRRRHAKRLARYLAFHFRMHAAHGDTLTRTVGPLLEALNLEVDRRNPERSRVALEAALSLLAEDKLLTGWRYADAESLPARGWVPSWLRWRLVLTPPPLLQDRYARLRKG